MKKLFIIVVVLCMASVAMAQFFPVKLGLELLNAKVISKSIYTTGTADVTIPLWIAPCNGYIITEPRLTSASGSAVSDTTAALHWEFYFGAGDSIATAWADTIAQFRTDSSAVTLLTINTRGRLTALKNHKMNFLSSSSCRRIYKRDVISLRCESVGSTPTAVTNMTVDFTFIPTWGYEKMPR